MVLFILKLIRKNALGVIYDKQHIELIKDYDHLSIREQSGKHALEQFLYSKNIAVTCDPTFLITPDCYEIFDLKRIIKGEYVFVYTVRGKNDVLSFAQKLSQKLGIPAYTMIGSNIYRIIKAKYYRIKLKPYKNGPIEFLRYIKNAKYVVTDSFHATAFSVIFKKPFYSINTLTDNQLFNDDRLFTLLKRLGIEERYVTLENFDLLNVNDEINYEAVTKQKEEYANESIQWLKNSIEN